MSAHRIAVSVLVQREGRPDEALLVRRNPELAFFGGYWAFPGGTLDGDDEAVPVEGPLPADVGGDFRPFVVAAARELFEETGLWLGRGGSGRLDPDGLAADRRRLLAGEARFGALLAARGQHLDARDVRPLCRITTPPFAPRRYDSWFVRVVVPDEATVSIVPGELEEGSFFRAAVALERWRRGTLLVVPPVLILLEELARDPEGFPERARRLAAGYDRGKLHRVFFTPGVLLAPLATPTKPPATHTNTYVVGDERLVVVDPAPVDRGEQERLFELLDELVGEGRTLEAILLTHHHPDHVGAVEPCRRRYELPVLAHPETAARLEAGLVSKTIGEGDRIELGAAPDGRPGWRLDVYHVPGHAPGHLAFKESRYRALLVGDLVSTLSSILIDPEDGHLATYLRSLERAAGLAEATVYPGHGPPAREGRAAIEAQRRHRAERERQLLAALAGGPKSLGELLAEVYADVPPALHGLAERSLLSGLVKLEEEGRLTRTAKTFALK